MINTFLAQAFYRQSDVILICKRMLLIIIAYLFVHMIVAISIQIELIEKAYPLEIE